MVNKRILVIALVALILCSFSPFVSAYTLLDTVNTTGATADSGFSTYYVSRPCTFYQNVTYITWDGYGSTNNASLTTGSQTIRMYPWAAPTNIYGNMTVTWNWQYSAAANYTKPASMTWTIIDFNKKTASCSSILTFEYYQQIPSFNTAFAFKGSTPADAYYRFHNVGSSAGVVPNGTWNFYGGSAVTTPVASFTCTPTSQYPNHDVVCTDSSTNTPTDWYWTIDAESWGTDAWQTSTSRNFTWQSAYPGLYSVNLRANNSAGFDWENKSNYVSISENATPNNCYLPLASGYSRTKFRCMNPSNDATVFGCNQQLNDVEGGAWSNQSDLSDGIWCIDTLPLHHINAYGDATGYTSGSRIGVQEWNNMQYTIPLIPGYVPNATAGNVWVYIYVSDYLTYGPISGAQVSLSGNGLTTQSALTGSSGSASLQWPNQTVAYINVVKSGYTSASKVITTSTTGPDIAYITLHSGTAISTLTPNPTPTGGPTAIPTQDTRTASQKDIDMMNLIRDNGSALIGLAIITTMLGLMKMWGK